MIFLRKIPYEEEKLIYSLIKQEWSINQISKHLDRSKSTIYSYYRKILPKKLKIVTINKDDEFVGELMGLFAGDGSYFYDTKGYRHVIRFHFNIQEKEFAKELIELFSKNLDKIPASYRERNEFILRYYSNELTSFIRNYVKWGVSLDVLGRNRKSRTVFLEDFPYSNEFKIGFLRGFLDSDGHYSDKKIVFASSSKKLCFKHKCFLIP